MTTSTLPLPPPKKSWAHLLAELPEAEREALLAAVPEDYPMERDWWLVARREQLPPEGLWLVWIMMAGRGFGKTRAGAEWLIDQHREAPDGYSQYPTGIIAATTEDLKRYCLRGPSGILSVAPPDFYPRYEPGNTRLVWPDKSETLLFTAEKPERIRGPNLRAAWCDEFASWKYLEETWDNLMFALRESELPRAVITTTPKPKALLRQLLADPEVVVTGGSTFDNSYNLSERAMARLLKRYHGTRKGEQELYARILDESEGALWKREWFTRTRAVKTADIRYNYSVTAVDPAATSEDNSDETGIIHAGRVGQRRGYVDEDLSGRYSPEQWARAAILCYFRHDDDAIVVEKNNGGDMVALTIRATAKGMRERGEIPHTNITIRTVWASKSKAARAEPVSALYEQGLITHLGEFPALEDQCCTWEPLSGDRSPDRLDALVWAMTELFVRPRSVATVPPVGIGHTSHWHPT